MWWNTLGVALKQLWRNKLRTALTSLGILIGVAAVIAMVTLGKSATERVNQDLSGLGENLLFVVPGNQRAMGGRGAARPLSVSDARAIATGSTPAWRK